MFLSSSGNAGFSGEYFGLNARTGVKVVSEEGWVVAGEVWVEPCSPVGVGSNLRLPPGIYGVRVV